jgi:type IV pilus assembly protein PilV
MTIPVYQKGSSLLEVLISLVVLAIGILGVFALQTSSLKSNQNAYLRSQAALLANDLIERARSNRQGFLDGAYNAPLPSLTAECLTTTGCTPAALAAHDVAEWQAALGQLLPLGGGMICIDSTPDDGTIAVPACDDTGAMHVVKTWWDDDRDGMADQLLASTFQQ